MTKHVAPKLRGQQGSQVQEQSRGEVSTMTPEKRTRHCAPYHQAESRVDSSPLQLREKIGGMK